MTMTNIKLKIEKEIDLGTVEDIRKVLGLEPQGSFARANKCFQFAVINGYLNETSRGTGRTTQVVFAALINALRTNQPPQFVAFNYTTIELMNRQYRDFRNKLVKHHSIPRELVPEPGMALIWAAGDTNGPAKWCGLSGPFFFDHSCYDMI